MVLPNMRFNAINASKNFKSYFKTFIEQSRLISHKEVLE
jgi:hypothetical protein